MKKIKSAVDGWLNKGYNRDYVIVFSVVLAIFLAVGGDGLADIAKKKFWWSFWSVAQIVCLVGIVGGWLYLWKGQNREKD